MSKKNVLVQAKHVIYDDKGQPMSPGFSYSVIDTPLIESLISEGFLSVDEVKATEPKDEEKKPAVQTKNSKNQETVSSNPTGEL